MEKGHLDTGHNSQFDDVQNEDVPLTKSAEESKEDAKIDMFEETDQEVFDTDNIPGNHILNAVDVDEFTVDDGDSALAKDHHAGRFSLNKIPDCADNIVPIVNDTMVGERNGGKCTLEDGSQLSIKIVPGHARTAAEAGDGIAGDPYGERFAVKGEQVLKVANNLNDGIAEESEMGNSTEDGGELEMERFKRHYSIATGLGLDIGEAPDMGKSPAEDGDSELNVLTVAADAEHEHGSDGNSHETNRSLAAPAALEITDGAQASTPLSGRRAVTRHRRYASLDSLTIPTVHQTEPTLTNPIKPVETRKLTWKSILSDIWNNKWSICWWIILFAGWGFLNWLLMDYRKSKAKVKPNADKIHVAVLGVLFWIFFGWLGKIVGLELMMFMSFITLEFASVCIELAFSLE